MVSYIHYNLNINGCFFVFLNKLLPVSLHALLTFIYMLMFDFRNEFQSFAYLRRGSEHTD
jgi:hypothetical protein